MTKLMSSISNENDLDILLYPRGETGAVFTPSVDANGNLSWTNNGGLPNPPTANIKGPQGERGPQGLLEFKIVEELPEVGEETVLYLVPARIVRDNNLYNEYIWVNEEYELISEGIAIASDIAQYIIGYYYNINLLTTLNKDDFLYEGEFALKINTSTVGIPAAIENETQIILKTYQSQWGDEKICYQELINLTDGKKYNRIVEKDEEVIYGEWTLGATGGIEISSEEPTDSSAILWIDESDDPDIFDPNQYLMKDTISINGKNTNQINIYAPTSSGQNGQVLISKGVNETPVWEDYSGGGGTGGGSIYYIGPNEGTNDNPFIIENHGPGAYAFYGNQLLDPARAFYIKINEEENGIKYINTGSILFLSKTKEFLEGDKIGYVFSTYYGSIEQLYYTPGANGGVSSGGSYEALVSKAGIQTIVGQKTFNSLPKSSIVPTDNEHFTNKKYVDDQLVAAKSYADTIESNAKSYTDTAVSSAISIIGDNKIKGISFVESLPTTYEQDVLYYLVDLNNDITVNITNSNSSGSIRFLLVYQGTSDESGKSINVTVSGGETITKTIASKWGNPIYCNIMAMSGSSIVVKNNGGTIASGGVSVEVSTDSITTGIMNITLS